MGDDNMIGKRFGRLTVIGRAGSIKGKRLSRKTWYCVCDCGTHVVANTKMLTSGHKKSCGCLYKESRTKKRIPSDIRDKHLHLEIIWNGIKQRCTNPNSPEYHRYGGRGIKMCDEWLNDSRKFISWGIANGYETGLSIDRIDNDGNYEPSNCQFLTRSENVLKQKRNITICGVTLRYSELSKIVGCADKYFKNRILRVGFNKAYIGLFHKLAFNVA